MTSPNKIREDLGYDRPPDPETDRRIKAFLEGKMGVIALDEELDADPATDWRITDEERAAGRPGLESARSALRGQAVIDAEGLAAAREALEPVDQDTHAA